ncbi:MAG TPA: NAD(P)-dependent oxidoreductase [Candidatus Saccharimonadales bacterium]
MPHKIVVLANARLLPEDRERISKLSSKPVEFPDTEDQFDITEMTRRTGDAEIVLVNTGTKITAEYLKACPSIKYIGLCGTSTENIDLQAVSDQHISLTNVVDYGDEPTAEFIFYQLVFLARGMGKYQWFDYPTELIAKSIGIIGLGALGQSIAHLALAYKMQVNYYSKHRKPEWEKKGVKYAEKTELLKSSDIVIISSPTNIKVIDEGDFKNMKPNSVLVQASSGNCFDRTAFLNWLEKGNHYAIFDLAAGIDHYNSYKDLPRVVFPKVIAGFTRETKQRLGNRVIENLKNYIDKKA